MAPDDLSITVCRWLRQLWRCEARDCDCMTSNNDWQTAAGAIRRARGYCICYVCIMNVRRVAKKRRQTAWYAYSRKYHATSIKLSVISSAGALAVIYTARWLHWRHDDISCISRGRQRAFHITADRDVISTSDWHVSNYVHISELRNYRGRHTCCWRKIGAHESV